MERIKNFLYDISDALIKLIVVACMIFVIAVKLNTAMPDINILGDGFKINTDLSESNSPIGKSKEISIDLTKENVTVNEKNDNKKIKDDNSSGFENGQQDLISEENQTQQPQNPQNTLSSQNAQINSELELITKTVTIPSGYTSKKIAGLLENEKIIKDSEAFLKVVSELGYSSKLRMGSYTLNSDMTYEEIANKLVGL